MLHYHYPVPCFRDKMLCILQHLAELLPMALEWWGTTSDDDDDDDADDYGNDKVATGSNDAGAAKCCSASSSSSEPRRSRSPKAVAAAKIRAKIRIHFLKMVVVVQEPELDLNALLNTALTEQRTNSGVLGASAAGIGTNGGVVPEPIIGIGQEPPLGITSITKALDLLEASVKVHNVSLVRLCVENVDMLLAEPVNILPIFLSIRKCKLLLHNMSHSPTLGHNNGTATQQQQPQQQQHHFIPTAPPLYPLNGTTMESCQPYIVQLIDQLRHNCLLVMDQYADDILRQKEINDLCYEDLLEFTIRDTLRIRSESRVYASILRWGQCEMERKRRHSGCLLSLREVLNNLRLAPRYGLMTKAEFTSRRLEGEKGPTKSGVLESHEIDSVVSYIKVRDKLTRRKTAVPRRDRNDAITAATDEEPLVPEALLTYPSWGRDRHNDGGSSSGGGRDSQYLASGCAGGGGALPPRPYLLSRRLDTPKGNEHASDSRGGGGLPVPTSPCWGERSFLNFLTCWAAVFD